MQINRLKPSVLLDEPPTTFQLTRPEKVYYRRPIVFFALLKLMLSNFLLWLRGLHRSRQHARQLREFAERLGYLWIRIGQLMAMRADMYSDVFCNELDKLQYPSYGVPFDVVRATLENELGRPLEEVFAHIETMPFRAGFTYQVHRGRLHGAGPDDLIAIKVQRPNIEAIFRRDFQAFSWLIRFFKMFGLYAHIQWEHIQWELEQAITTEIDYDYEASNLRRMRRIMRKRRIYVPKVFGQHSSRRVLVTEYVQGARLSDIVLATHTNPQGLADWLTENNVNLRRVGHQLFRCFLRQLIEDNVVHGSLHHNNVILLRNSRFALVDFSVLHMVESEFLRRYVQSLRAVSTYQYGRAVDLTLLLCPELPPIDVTSLKERLVRCFRAWDARSELKRMPQHEKSLASLYRELSRVLFRYRITPTQTFMRICYTWDTLDDSLCLLIPDVNFSRLFRRQFEQVSLQSFREAFQGRAIMEFAFNLKDNVTEYHQILGSMLRRGALVFQGGTTKLSDAMASIFRLFRLVSFAGLTYFVLKLLDIHDDTLFDDTVMDAPLDAMTLNASSVVVILVTLGYLFFMFGKLEKRFRQQDVRLPNSNGGAFGR